MHYYEIAPTKIFRAGADILTYEYDQELQPGTLVLIPLGKKTIPGLIIKEVNQPNFPTKPIEKILYDQPLPSHLLASLLWLNQYYACPLPTVLQTALPKGIEKTRRVKTKSPPGNSSEHSVSPVKKSDSPSSDKLFERSEFLDEPEEKKTFSHTRANGHSEELPVEILLNSAQQTALRQINSCKTNTALLHGITGSGKTNIYLELTRQTLESGKSVILLVPEIALTSQLVQNFKSHFYNITLLHSKQTEANRHLLWENILTSEQPQVIIGPRSALFAPVKNLGLVIIDEAHEPAYHQDQAPKYSATKLASVMIGVVKNTKTDMTALALFGTATPTIPDYYLAEQQNAIIKLDELAIKKPTTTYLRTIDLKDRTNFKKHRLFSDQLLTSIQNSLNNKTQTMIFHNRRGSAPLTICDHCGWQALCSRCLLPLNLHTDRFALICHTCGYKTKVPTGCPSCNHTNILHKGFGTKLLEVELTKLFGDAKIARFDADTETEKALHLTYDEVKNGHFDIIIGTQMIAKGFDFPRLTTLGVVQADAGLSLPDFSSEERTFQLLTQVIGRANRGHQDSNIIIQTFQPDHPVIKFGASSDYRNLYNYIIKNRQKSVLPPYSFLLKLSLTYKTEEACVRNVKKLRLLILERLKAIAERNQEVKGCGCGVPAPLTSCRETFSAKSVIEVSQPTPAFHERTPRGYTWQLVIKSKKRQLLLDIVKNLPKNPQLHFHLDPPTLL